MLHRSISAGRWAAPLLSGGEFKVDLLRDFRIDSDGISVWTGPAGSAAKALAVGQRQIAKIVLLEIDEEILEECDIDVVYSPGNVPRVANPEGHRNIVCHSGARLWRLLERLSQNPSIREFDANEVRGLLKECLADGLRVAELKPRVIEELIRKKLVGEGEGRRALGELYEREPCVISELRASEVVALVDADIVPRESGVLLHRGFVART